MPVEFLNWMQNLNDAQVNAFEINIGIEFCKSISKKRKMNNKFIIFFLQYNISTIWYLKGKNRSSMKNDLHNQFPGI